LQRFTRADGIHGRPIPMAIPLPSVLDCISPRVQSI
jgi:hypothetical protein